MEDLAESIQTGVDICDQGPWMLPEATRAPTGAEQGEALVIGVGGSTLRLRHVTISSHRCHSGDLLSVPITADVRAGSDLFDWCAAQLRPALDRWTAQRGSPPPIAVSWSFPLLQGRILSMGKSFGAHYNGHDVVARFNAALAPHYAVASVTHDGTSSLVAGIHQSPRCVMALTLGTGVNINLRLRDGRLVNTEISMLGRRDTTPHIDLYKARFDVRDDRAAFQPLEAQVGGMYLGEMASSAVQQPMSTLDVWAVLDSPQDGRYAAVDAIVVRAASLVAAAIYGLALFGGAGPPAGRGGGGGPGGGGRPPAESAVEVVYTGGVIFEPQFRSRLETRLAVLAKKFGFRVRLVPQQFGSEIGAAVSALTELGSRRS